MGMVLMVMQDMDMVWELLDILVMPQAMLAPQSMATLHMDMDMAWDMDSDMDILAMDFMDTMDISARGLLMLKLMLMLTMLLMVMDMVCLDMASPMYLRWPIVPMSMDLDLDMDMDLYMDMDLDMDMVMDMDCTDTLDISARG